MGKLTFAVVAILAAFGVTSSLAEDCCQSRVVEGASGDIENGEYQFTEEDNATSRAYGCADNCLYVKDGEKYCFKMETDVTHDVTCKGKGDSYVLLIGGENNRMESWSPNDETLPTYNPVPSTFGFLTGSRAARLGNKIYSCAGGQEGDTEKCYSTVPGQLTWTRESGLDLTKKGRNRHTLTAVGDKLVLTGGRYPNKYDYDDVYILYPGSTEWTNPGWSLIQPVREHCAVADSDSSIVIIGGLLRGMGSTAVTRYDLNTKKSTSLTNLPDGIGSLACVMYQNKITISGGLDYGAAVSSVRQLEGDEWVRLPSMKKPRAKHQMAVLNNELYVFGGINPAEQSVEKLDSKSGKWIPEKKLKDKFVDGGIVVV